MTSLNQRPRFMMLLSVAIAVGTVVAIAASDSPRALWRTFTRMEPSWLAAAVGFELLAYVGPPILDSFRDRAGMSLGEAAEALAIYRPRYLESGALDATVFPGVAEVIRAVDGPLAPSPCRLGPDPAAEACPSNRGARPMVRRMGT